MTLLIANDIICHWTFMYTLNVESCNSEFYILECTSLYSWLEVTVINRYIVPYSTGTGTGPVPEPEPVPGPGPGPFPVQVPVPVPVVPVPW